MDKTYIEIKTNRYTNSIVNNFEMKKHSKLGATLIGFGLTLAWNHALKVFWLDPATIPRQTFPWSLLILSTQPLTKFHSTREIYPFCFLGIQLSNFAIGLLQLRCLSEMNIYGKALLGGGIATPLFGTAVFYNDEVKQKGDGNRFQEPPSTLDSRSGSVGETLQSNQPERPVDSGIETDPLPPVVSLLPDCSCPKGVSSALESQKKNVREVRQDHSPAEPAALSAATDQLSPVHSVLSIFYRKRDEIINLKNKLEENRGAVPDRDSINKLVDFNVFNFNDITKFLPIKGQGENFFRLLESPSKASPSKGSFSKGSPSKASFASESDRIENIIDRLEALSIKETTIEGDAVITEAIEKLEIILGKMNKIENMLDEITKNPSERAALIGELIAFLDGSGKYSDSSSFLKELLSAIKKLNEIYWDK